MVSSPRRRGRLAAGCFGRVDGVEAASLAVLERESSTRRAARTARTHVARRFQCAGWRSAEEYAQGEYGDEISWFSDSGLVEKVQNRQGLFMYFKRCPAASALLRMVGAGCWSFRSRRRRGGGPRVVLARDDVDANRSHARRAQAPRVPRQVPAARQDLRVRERRRPQVDDHDPVDFRTHERKTKT